MEGLLAAPDAAVASHQTAAFLLGLTPAPTQVHLTMPPELRMRVDGVVAHRSVLPSHHVARLGPARVTTLARTVVDLASVCDFDQLAEMGFGDT